MKKTILAIGVSLLMLGCGDSKSNSLLITIDSKYNMKTTIDKFVNAIEKKGYKVISQTNHHETAKSENIYLHPTISVTLDNPKVFSALLTCNQSLAIDLPMRISAYSQLGGDVKLAYTQPEYWSLKHNIKDKNCIEIVLGMARDMDEAVGVLQ